MKNLLFTLIIFVCTAQGLFSQKLQVNETDKVSGKKRMETDYSTLLSKDYTYLAIKYRSLDSIQYIEFRGGDVGVGVVTPKDPLIILLDDDSHVTLYPTSRQDFTLDDNRKYYRHEYVITKEQIDTLSKHKCTSIRKFANGQYEDIDIPVKNQRNLLTISAFFLKHLT